MMNILRKILPSFPPRFVYNIFLGTNKKEDFWLAVKSLFGSQKKYTNCDEINKYETAFAGICHSKHAFSFGSGRMALYAILEALDIGEGDEVIIPAFTCIVVVNAILYRKARPVYVDIRKEDFNIDADRIESAITSKTKALYAQHTFGVVCDVDKIKQLAAKHNLLVIEDGAHALGAMFHGKPVGSLGDVAFFSTDHSKIISTYSGGMVTTSSEVIAGRMREIQSRTPFLSVNNTRHILFSFILEYVLLHPVLFWLCRPIHRVLAKTGILFAFNDTLLTQLPNKYAYPCKLSAPQARIGLNELSRLKPNLFHRRQVALAMDAHIGYYRYDLARMNEQAWLRYSFMPKNRERVIRYLEKYFDLGIWFTSVLHGRNDDLQEVGYQEGSCVVAEGVVNGIVNIPTHVRIPMRVIERLIEKKAFKNALDPLNE